MKKWLVAALGLLAVVFATKYIIQLKNENTMIEQKLSDERNRIAFLKHTVEEDERKLDLESLQKKRRLENLNQLILEKKKDLQGIEDRILNLSQSPDAAKAKLAAQADLKIQKDRVQNLQDQMKSLEQSKINRKGETQESQKMFEDRFRTQDTNLNYQIKGAEDNLRALEAEFNGIKVIRRDPVAINEKNSKAQEVINQKAYLSDLKRQKRELSEQHAIQKNELNSSLTADQGEVDRQMAILKNQLKDESARYEILDKNLKSFANSEEGIRSQLKFLQTQKQNLTQEISDLEASH